MSDSGMGRVTISLTGRQIDLPEIVSSPGMTNVIL